MFTVFRLTSDYISCVCIFRQASVNGYCSPSTQLIVLLYYVMLCYVVLCYVNYIIIYCIILYYNVTVWLYVSTNYIYADGEY